MSPEREKLPLDAKILGEAIIELNISRRNVTIYPKGHPSVEQSLHRAYEKLQKLFEIRPEVTFSLARDTIIVDDYYLEKTNPVYREFANHLSAMGIASVSFLTGVAKDEIYSFHSLLTLDPEELTLEDLIKEIDQRRLIHIRVMLVDYDAFTFEEGKVTAAEKEALWEKYVYGLIEGTLRTEEMGDTMREIPPELLASMMNRLDSEELKEETYDHVITTYMRRSAERAFSGSDLKRLMDFINSLKPELKKQFLSSSVKNLSMHSDAMKEALKETSVDEIIDLLKIINEQKVAIPDALKNLLDRFSHLQDSGFGETRFRNHLISDDIFLSKSAINLLEGGNFSAYVTDRYQKDIEKLLEFDASRLAREESDLLQRACIDEIVERYYSHVLQELLLQEVITEEEYMKFAEEIYLQAGQFLETGQYEEVLRILYLLEENLSNNRFPHITEGLLRNMKSGDFILLVIASFQITGRLNREGASALARYYGEMLSPYLMDALREEESSAVRSFLIMLLSQFGNSVIPLALKLLGSREWFVKRNMIHLLSLTENPEVIPHIRVYCRHENRRVSLEATKALIKLGDSYGIEMVREMMLSGKREDMEQAASLAGAFRIRKVIPDMVSILRRKPVTPGDFTTKIPFVRALGEMGDPSVIPVLKDLAGAKSILFRTAVEEMKEEIYRSLKNYPYSEVADILQEGIRSRNETIRTEAERLIRKQEGGR